jgi:hypothetical protein
MTDWRTERKQLQVQNERRKLGYRSECSDQTTSWMAEGSYCNFRQGKETILPADHLDWGLLSLTFKGNAVSFCGVKRSVCEAD